MLGRLSLAGALTALIIATPASAATKEDKIETCKVGADSQNLEGAKRDAFIKRCMAAGNYEPQARKDAMKKTKKTSAAKKKPATPPAAAAPPAQEPAGSK